MMVQYICERCKSVFNKKSRYVDHLARKIPCPIVKDDIENEIENENYCEICDRAFSRKDALTRHKKSKNHKLLAIKPKIKNNGNLIVNKGNNNKNKIIVDNSTNNYFFIAPFSQEEIDGLTPEEKLLIFTSNENPIVMIIIKTNLNPTAYQYHNVGYTNMNKSYGYIFNGETWQKKEISAIMNELLNSKRKDLLTIYDEIKEYLPDEDNKNIQIKIDNIKNTVEPKHEHHARSKRKLVLNLKNTFCNNKHLIIEAMEKSGKPIIDNYKIKTNPIRLKEGYTMEDVIREMNQKKENAKRMVLKKELAKDLLDQLDEIDKDENKLLSAVIENTQEIDTLNLIIRLLNLSYCFGDEINNNLVQEKIKKNIEEENFIFG
ncbi:mg15 protein [Tupanvirus deep ocean]|uniref:Mg15 protein n=2 Tax=Tupanvirus TaxID=2094720 RepID=A0A2K9L704_9VIRU|nr:mg15 protein [Tupanvirus deep ocean]YP_010782339.1 hypothetical protein QJ857_gp0368 [Tupanvirus soda lake]AUL78462.1 hypothetical protein [Tupanvirus soda lake]AUL79791.1 mg15 protein [Tupanvirus deep ocean]